MDRNLSFSVGGNGVNTTKVDEDGRPKRTGTVMTASAHIITAVIGSGVLSLAWATAQLGWLAGSISLAAFSLITWFTSVLLADCYRSPHPVNGSRNYTYMEVVAANLGGRKVMLCGLAQYGNMFGVTVGYTITTSISMAAIKRSNCFHKYHTREGCHTENNEFILMFGIIQILLSQIPNFHKLSVLSYIAAIMSFGYSSIGLGLCIVQIASGTHPETSLTGIPVGKDISAMQKMWTTFSALGNIAFAYAFSTVLVEIQDTLKSSPPENKAMKTACFIGISVSSLFYILCGVLGYAAFGNNAPGNLLTGFGFYEPFWLVDIANVFIVIHLIGAYQVFAQPLFGFIEAKSKKRWPESKFINEDHLIDLPLCGMLNFSFFRLIWRTTYVILTTILAMAFPNFNDIVGLLGAASFWPLTVYFPIEMYISQAKIRPFSWNWTWMKILSFTCLIITLVAAAGSIQGIIHDLPTLKPFKSVS